jgi:hypothetical protein
MFRIRIQQRRPGERWRFLGDATTDLAKPLKLADTQMSESDLVSVQIEVPPGNVPAVRLRVGSVLVASSIATDRVRRIDYDDASEAEAPPLVCRGKLLADWVGLTELTVEVRRGDASPWLTALTLPLVVAAGKLETEQLNQLFNELEHAAAAVLLDVHGKTQVGLKAAPQPGSSAPVAVLSRLRETIRELNDLLHRMARQPASRLRTQASREQALIGQAISEATLAEACRDPNLLGRRGAQLLFREHLREHSRPSYRIPEHQVIADFSEYLKAQLADLRHRIDAEVADREARKRWRNVAHEPGKPSWWETEDLPRIDELQRCRQEVAELRGTVNEWCKLAFLPPGRCLRQKPQSTQLFRNHVVYRRAFRVIAGHFLTYQATLDTHHLLTRARSLPVLYEWWCAVRLISILTDSLTPLLHDASAEPLISTRLAQEGRRFTIEFAADQAINFRDRQGARVRFRYQPAYTSCRGRTGAVVGTLDAGALRTPDMALEVFPARPTAVETPELIIVLDAKFSSLPQAEKLTEVTTKYSKIGDGRTGRVLSRQVWALTPVAPSPATPGEGLRPYCTVDNEAFWSDQFDVNNPVNAAIQTRPISPGAADPLRMLIVSLLRLADVDYAPDARSATAG